MANRQIPFLVSIPHSGEKIPPQTPWLQGLPEDLLMCDVDRFVDLIYSPAMQKLAVPFVKTEWHRYAADLNRIPSDIDSSSVIGSVNEAGKFSRGFHWVHTTHKQILMSAPMTQQTHDELVKLIYDPFHSQISQLYQDFHEQGWSQVFHLDVHSMPSMGTSEHRDPGQYRADIVISDCGGASSSKQFRDLVIAAYVTAGFKVGYNWPYLGGRITEVYGCPQRNEHVLQVEMNRALYMDEKSKKILPEQLPVVQEKIVQALGYIIQNTPVLMQSGIT